MISKFYIVATPIGNLQDITLRALDVLKSSSVIVCEDSRITMRLLEKYDIKNKKLLIYNDNSDNKAREKILQLLKQNIDVAFVSDAGTPLISDPGHKLVIYLRENKVEIVPIPGASSVLTALCASGIACDNFLFVGFLPSSSVQRQNQLKTLPQNFTLVFFESPVRALETLSDLLIIFGDRKICVARELTKIHEEIITDNISAVINFFKQNQDKIRGEFVVILEKKDRKEKEISDEELTQEIKKMIADGFTVKEASSHLSQMYNLNKKNVYQLAIKVGNFTAIESTTHY